MGALGRWLEEEGIATTQISLVREHTAAISPPRALWVSFIMGRPLGVPGDPAFQRCVLLAALRLITQDIKAYYHEAVTAQPGARVAHAAREWFWRDTTAGKAFMQLREACLASGNEAVRRFGGRSLIPLAVAPRPKDAP